MGDLASGGAVGVACACSQLEARWGCVSEQNVLGTSIEQTVAHKLKLHKLQYIKKVVFVVKLNEIKKI